MVDYTNLIFAVENDELVMYAVAKSTGKPYRHTCPQASFEAVACALEEAPDGLTRDQLREGTGLAWSRIAVALLFLDERSIIERKGRRGQLCIPATEAVLLDAMTEYHAVREGA
ncbi:MAG: hypothetical protein KF678_10920 [Phycisphaeraceae bacterium]|nr:hypothetical protein [Phycisphaeraceae bacterium]